jgi:O-antigen/teichoic acid export membrane protein
MHQGIPVFRNVVYNFLSQVWFLVLPLATSPYIVRHLGVDAFGVLSLASAIIGYLAVLDLGMGTATIKYIADAYVAEDFRAVSKVIGTSIIIYSGLGLLGTLGILATANLIVTRLLHVPANLVSITLIVFYVSSLGFLVNMPLTVFNSIPNALQRFDILVKQNLVLGTVAVLGQVVLLGLGYSLKALVVFNVATSAVGICIFVLVARRLLPGVSFRPVFDGPTAKQIMRFSALKVFSVVSGQIVFQLDKVLIAAFLPLASVSYYVVPLSLAQKIISVIPNITTAVFPAVSEFKADKERLKDLYVRVAKGVLMAVLPITVVLIMFAEKILAFWMGAEFALRGTATLRYLAIAFFLASFAAVPGVFVEGLGKPGIPAFFAAISAVLNLGFALLFIPRWGIAGPALALIANSLITVPLFIDRVNRKVLGVRNTAFLRGGFVKPVLAAVPMFLFFAILKPHARNLLELGGLVVAGSGLYVLLCLLSGAVDAAERKMIAEYWKAMTRGGPKNAS